VCDQVDHLNNFTASLEATFDDEKIKIQKIFEKLKELEIDKKSIQSKQQVLHSFGVKFQVPDWVKDALKSNTTVSSHEELDPLFFDALNELEKIRENVQTYLLSQSNLFLIGPTGGSSHTLGDKYLKHTFDATFFHFLKTNGFVLNIFFFVFIFVNLISIFFRP
jgi:hypothetical protein